MNTEEKSKYDIEDTKENLAEVEQTLASLRNKTSHVGFKDAKRVVELTDQADALEGTLRHEEEHEASDRA